MVLVAEEAAVCTRCLGVFLCVSTTEHQARLAGEGDTWLGSQVLGWMEVWAKYWREVRLASWLLEG